VLRLGVGLLGARVTAAQIAGLGWHTALLVVAAVAFFAAVVVPLLPLLFVVFLIWLVMRATSTTTAIAR